MEAKLGAPPIDAMSEGVFDTGNESKEYVDKLIAELMARITKRDPEQAEFLQAVEEVITSLKGMFYMKPHYLEVMEVIVEPERMIIFRVPWIDDQHVQHVNRGFRVQFSSVLGPYKGGLRLHPSVNLSIIKFLGFEQIFKNALTLLPMGAGKGGSDFDPKGKSDLEVLNFCQSFMTELSRHIGANTDVPAGDIGVGGREIGFLFGQYKRLTKLNDGGVLTGKAVQWSGSYIRPEATGYGLVYFTECALNTDGLDFKDKVVVMSGSGNVSQYAAEKCIQLGAKVVTLSDSSGYIYEPEGITMKGLQFVMHLKEVKRGRIKEYCDFSSTAKFFPGEKPWKNTKADIAMPNATQNEIDIEDAKGLVANGVKYVGEGANMPTYTDAIHLLKSNGVVFLPAKAANAGGVATSGLEMAQNSQRLQWSREEVDAKLKTIMQNIYKNAQAAAKMLGNERDIQTGANAAGFLRIAKSMISQGSAVYGLRRRAPGQKS
jgi:glutamate dehydrogenase/leucine dehydrogenase